MPTRLGLTLIAVLTWGSTEYAFARGGRGGGGVRPGGGISDGGGRAIGSSPSIGRAGGPAAARPATSSARPGAEAGSRPNLGGGDPGVASRPATLPGTGSKLGAGPGALPGTQPNNRPAVGLGPGAAGQGNANRSTASGRLATNGNLSGVARPAQLPGLGTGAAGARLPNQGANLPQTREARQADLGNRMTTGREDWQSHRQDMQGNRQDWRTGNREDWQNWADGNINNHGDWYHDSWHGGWYPGAGWNNMWNNYPVATALGVTAWGVNRLAYGFGYWGYANPYAGGGGYDYSQPLVSYSDSGTNATTAGQAPSPATPTAPPAPDAGMQGFNEARTAFYDGDSAKSLTLLDLALKTMPRDTVAHEFRGLVLFSLHRYSESAAAIYAVLSAGPGWDWTTLTALYPRVDVYTQQLRALEEFVKSNPQAADAHFLLGYHYLTMGYVEAAAAQFTLALAQSPNDKLLAQLVKMTTPPDQATLAPAAQRPEPPAVPKDKVLSAQMLVGRWKASSPESEFQLELAKDGGFVWTYVHGKARDTVKGVFAVDQNNLALEPDAGGTMLAEIDFANPSQFTFKMIGDGDKSPGLQFKKGP